MDSKQMQIWKYTQTSSYHKTQPKTLFTEILNIFAMQSKYTMIWFDVKPT